MSKTFKSPTSPVTVTVTPDCRGALIKAVGDSESLRAISVSAKTAPAFVLAILEAAGWPEEAKTSITRTIMQDLRFVVDCVEKDAKEAADREALEGEAFALYSTKTSRVQAYPTVKDMESGSLEFWVAIAKTARELHGGTK